MTVSLPPVLVCTDFKVPREVIVLDELPRATLDKINKAELRRMARDELSLGGSAV